MKQKTSFTWSDAIIETLKQNNFVASLKLLHEVAPQIYSRHNEIKGLTPFKTINERVQRDKRIFKLAPGLYALQDKLKELPKEYNPLSQSKEQKENVNHISMQALLLQLGQIYNYQTYTPDKSKTYYKQQLGDFASLTEYPKFTYERIIERVKMIDVSWFNERELPQSIFEIENSTDMKNGLSKFMELIDFKTKMFIIAPQTRETSFIKIMQQPTFKPLVKQVLFWNYEKVEKLYQSEKETNALRSQIF
jgi:hypothetical protein